MEQDNKIALFEGKYIRRVWHNEEWYFVISDVILALTDSKNVKDYTKKLRKRDEQLNEFWGTNCPLVEVVGETGKKRKVSCANTEGVFRIIMSVPSPKAEPFRLWLAQVGKERLEDINDPELGFERLKEIYRAKGYPDEWIERRMTSIETRRQLTDEWKKRGVSEKQDYSVLTATIAKGTFGVTPSEHAQLKGLQKENLRDHMTPLELIFTALGEEITRSLAVRNDAQGFHENFDAAQQGGKEAGSARQNLEKNTGLKVLSDKNFLGLEGDETKNLE